MGQSFTCPVQAAFSVVGGKWKAGILFRLRGGSRRLGQLKRDMPWISEAVLIRQLKELVAAGIVVRQDFKVMPLHVEYRLTDYGRTLEPLLSEIGAWGQGHIRHMEAQAM
jgi:DNA-binding HxlR family transcriptional regulator